MLLSPPITFGFQRPLFVLFRCSVLSLVSELETPSHPAHGAAYPGRTNSKGGQGRLKREGGRERERRRDRLTLCNASFLSDLFPSIVCVCAATCWEARECLAVLALSESTYESASGGSGAWRGKQAQVAYVQERDVCSDISCGRHGCGRGLLRKREHLLPPVVLFVSGLSPKPVFLYSTHRVWCLCQVCVSQNN